MTSVARDRGVHEQGPRVDAAGQVGEMTEPLVAEVLGRLLAAYPQVALEDKRRVAIHAKERLVVRLIEQAGTLDRCQTALFLRADVHQLERSAALDQRFELVR